MRSEADRLYEILNTNAALTALVGDKIFPLVAHQKEKLPFITYYVSEDPSYSKAGKLEIIVTINSFAENYNDAAEITDAVKLALEDSSITEQFYYLGATPQFSEDKLIYIKADYKFKNE